MILHGTMSVNGKGYLGIGGCDTVELARKFGTPLYVIDEALFRQKCREYYREFIEKNKAEVVYAAKALLTAAICRLIEEEGLGLDIVSGGELYTALQAGFPVSRLYFHGNNKSAAEIKFALEAGVGCFVVDNLYELEMLNHLAKEIPTQVNILLRVTPGVEAHTHEYIKTGQIDSKFGLVIENGQALAGIKRALEMNGVKLNGLHCHIGSQIFELESYEHTAEVLLNFSAQVYRETGWVPADLNLGGGLGIYYAAGDRPCSIQEYAEVLITALQKNALKHHLSVPRLIVEPGRSICGPAGSTVYTVGAVKNIPGVRKYVTVDGGMSDNPRPALYQSRYEACLASKAAQPPVETVSVAGKCCESGDMLIWDIELPLVESGDILVVSCTGAYNYTMSMNYNRLPRPAMVLVNDGQADLILQRETYSDLIRNEVLPERLKKSRRVNIAVCKV
ncbi:MAG TPA: diaminopimelate decarboxylase [Desulfotomaculum sp.]|nr:diaminopimelate decarboxylase [Desulfotomaculum sp.]